MKGLIVKDLMNLKQQLTIYFLVIAIYLVLSISNHDSTFVGIVLMLYMFLLPINAMAYDEKAKWEPYALTMPVSRRSLVLSKYILMLLWAAIGIVLSMATGYFMDGSVKLALVSTAIFFGMGLLFGSILLPIIFWLGVEKGRMAMVAVILIPTILMVGASKLDLPAPPQQLLDNLVWIGPIAVLALFIGSVALSCRIYEKKEF